MTILDEIIERKKIEVREAKARVSLQELEAMPDFGRTCYSLKEAFQSPGRNGIIAEFKRASPSKGVINPHSEIQSVVKAYEDAGVSAISVLTDAEFFKGSLEDLRAARAAVKIPLLRKDFMIDNYQIAEAKAYGADIILLIAAALEPPRLAEMAVYAKSLGLNVLLEVHTLEELKPNCLDEVDAIGVNNRNLKDFSVSMERSLKLADAIPNRYIKVSESGISRPESIRELRDAGFSGFLIGENFMSATDPASSIQNFVKALRD